MSMNFDNHNSQPKPKSHTKTIIAIVIIAVIAVMAIIGGIELASRMNNVVAPFSSVKDPVSVLQAQSNMILSLLAFQS